MLGLGRGRSRYAVALVLKLIWKLWVKRDWPRHAVLTLTFINLIVCTSVPILAGNNIHSVEINTWTIVCSCYRSWFQVSSWDFVQSLWHTTVFHLLTIIFCVSSNGSVIPRLLIKIDAQAQISQRQLVDFMNETLRSGMLGKYRVDPTSLQSTGINFCNFPFLFERHLVFYFLPCFHRSSHFTDRSLFMARFGRLTLRHNKINLTP